MKTTFECREKAITVENLFRWTSRKQKSQSTLKFYLEQAVVENLFKYSGKKRKIQTAKTGSQTLIFVRELGPNSAIRRIGVQNMAPKKKTAM